MIAPHKHRTAAGRVRRSLCFSALPVRLVIGACSVTLAACVESPAVDPVRETTTVRDSAGIRVVENGADTAELPIWRPDSTPLLEVGVVSGEAAEQFGTIGDALRLDDGTLVIADGQVMEIRFFGPDGRHLRTVGGMGDGPGEFQTIFHLAAFAGDSVVAWDTFARRATIFSAEGEFVRTVRLEYPDATWPDGSPGPGIGLRPVTPVVGGGWISVGMPNAAKPPDLALPGTYAHPVTVLRHDAAGAIRDTLAEVAGRTVLYVPTALRELEGVPIGAHQTIVLGADDRAYVAVRDSGFVVARAEGFEIRVHAADGALLRLIRYPRLERPYEDAEVEARRETVLDRLEERELPPHVEEAFAAATRPEYQPEWRPTLSELRIGRDGGFWVAEWRGDPEAPMRWLAFAPDGRARAVAEIPRDLRPIEFGEDGVLAVRTDRLDVPYVGVWGWRSGG